MIPTKQATGRVGRMTKSRRRMVLMMTRLFYLLFSAGWLVTATAATQVAQPLLTLRLRSFDGTAVVGETVTLARLPEEQPVLPACTTDKKGQCTWRVELGLYQVLFRRPLDIVSAASVAEGGLRGLGLTVGEKDITYHFTLHTDGRVYFDSAPEAAVPQPVIPAAEDLFHSVTPTATRTVMPTPAVETPTATPQPVAMPEPIGTPRSRPVWRLLLTLGGGLVLGGGLHWWSRRRGERKPAGREGRDA